MLSRHCYDGYLGYCLYYYGVYDARENTTKEGKKRSADRMDKGKIIVKYCKRRYDNYL